ncbi:hypothetical protein BO71DRAFT_469191 [Aspergillus ellipticus CBS 707.79]|uniref:Acyltransferase 3 domain-containing protein n=1 Tax=Aspergillus ellipticus CBS 707.79 TaxID=1448320 RepID=A0A319DHQ5_9EURO|nr:hypothetical protein BO71DRAFT_469191 [Aspergillus ellipticus CBS 707.79]
MDRIQWIDGLRGIAALIVTSNHFICGEIKAPFRSFWAQPSEANRRIFQLPPFRLLWSMDAMVPLFMVMSSYTISHRLLKVRDNSAPDKLIDCLRSSILRRPIRLFLPVVALASCTQLLFYFGLYEGHVEERVATHIKPWASPCAHVRYLCEYVTDLLNIFCLQWNIGLNGHLWTMPLELRGSYLIYFTIFVQAVWRPRARLWCLGLMLSYLLWYGHWHTFCFLAGLGMAEVRVFRGQNTIIPPRWTADYVLRLAVALYILCLSAEDDYPPDYRFLRMFETEHWSRYDGWRDVRKTWHSIGAVLFFSVVLESPRLQRLLATRIPQSLGRLSFPMYLIHLSIFYMCSWSMRSNVWWLLKRCEYPASEEEDQYVGSLITVYVLSGGILLAVIMSMANVYIWLLDPQFARITRLFEMRLSQKSHQN